MKREIDLQGVKDYYGTCKATQTEKGFELPDDGRGFAVEVPSEFYVFLDGNLIDPTELLVDRMGWMRQQLFKNLNLCMPVSLRYAFGQLVEIEGEKVFCFQDPFEANFRSMDVLVEAEWNMHQGVTNAGWDKEIEVHWGKNILHQKSMPIDYYKSHGKQVWILHITNKMQRMMELKVDFYAGKQHVITGSDDILKKFAAEKEEYKGKIIEYLGRLQGEIHWIEVEDEEELLTKYNANRELWETQEYDWQVIIYDRHLEVYGRGGSPGVISGISPRFDEAGLEMCQDFVAEHT